MEPLECLECNGTCHAPQVLTLGVFIVVRVSFEGRCHFHPLLHQPRGEAGQRSGPRAAATLCVPLRGVGPGGRDFTPPRRRHRQPPSPALLSAVRAQLSGPRVAKRCPSSACETNERWLACADPCCDSRTPWCSCLSSSR
eukprot:EG_transcript_10889